MELPANELTKGRAQKPTELRKEVETFLFCQKQLSYVIIAYLITMSLVYVTFICCTAFFSYLFRCDAEIPMRLEHYFKALPLEEHIFT